MKKKVNELEDEKVEIIQSEEQRQKKIFLIVFS